MNASILLESWFTIYPFFAPRIADVTIYLLFFAQCIVLKTFNRTSIISVYYYNNQKEYTIIFDRINADIQHSYSLYTHKVKILWCILDK